jgi:D-serine dehydratase
MLGPIVVNSDEYLNRMALTKAKLEKATHLVWATGGCMVPAIEMEKYLSKAGS